MPASSSDYPVIKTTRLVKGEDLNHHETLYAGRCAEWSVQMAYITAQSCFDDPTPLVFMSIRNLSMRSPTRVGDLVEFTGRIDYVGESTIGVKVQVIAAQPRDNQKIVATGTFLFCTVDEQGKATPHGLAPVASLSSSAESRWRDAVGGVETGVS